MKVTGRQISAHYNEESIFESVANFCRCSKAGIAPSPVSNGQLCKMTGSLHFFLFSGPCCFGNFMQLWGFRSQCSPLFLPLKTVATRGQ